MPAASNTSTSSRSYRGLLAQGIDSISLNPDTVVETWIRSAALGGPLPALNEYLP